MFLSPEKLHTTLIFQTLLLLIFFFVVKGGGGGGVGRWKKSSIISVGKSAKRPNISLKQNSVLEDVDLLITSN